MATIQVLSFSTPELELAVLGLAPAVEGRPVEGRPVPVAVPVLVPVHGRDWPVRGRALEGREDEIISGRIGWDNGCLTKCRGRGRDGSRKGEVSSPNASGRRTSSSLPHPIFVASRLNLFGALLVGPTTFLSQSSLAQGA